MGTRIVRYVRRHHLALLALFVALSASAYAAAKFDSGDIVNNSLKSKDLKDSKAVKGADVVADSLGGADIDEATLAAAKRSHTATASADQVLTGMFAGYPFDGGSGAFTQAADEANLLAGAATFEFGPGCNPSSYGQLIVKLDGTQSGIAVASKTAGDGIAQTVPTSIPGSVIAAPSSATGRTLTTEVAGFCSDPDGSDVRITDVRIDVVAVP